MAIVVVVLSATMVVVVGTIVTGVVVEVVVEGAGRVSSSAPILLSGILATSPLSGMPQATTMARSVRLIAVSLRYIRPPPRN